jgi:pimeloyl-ACP methyl ester carboxylesterase
MRRPVGAPSALLQAAESRVVVEFFAFMASSPLIGLLPRGDGHPVLVLPGFIGNDESTGPLRWALRTLGYEAHGWDLGRNVGPTDFVLDGMEARLEILHRQYGEPVSLVGWSLGGIYARELARDNPRAVRQVISLGSPFRMRRDDRSSIQHIAERFEASWRPDALRRALAEHEKPPLSMPSTAIYSRSDGVVSWELCVVDAAGDHENVEVYGSHTGLGFNPAAVYAVVDRLSQPAGTWRPFRPPLALRCWYPRPASHSPAD